VCGCFFVCVGGGDQARRGTDFLPPLFYDHAGGVNSLCVTYLPVGSEPSARTESPPEAGPEPARRY